MLSKIKRIASFTIAILLIAILIVNLFLIKTGKKDTTFLGYSTAIVLSGSMEPEISVNDMLIIHEDEDYEVSDIVAYEEGNMLVTHRIIEESDDGYITKGDANNTADPKIDKNSVVGKVVLVIPGGGNLMRFFTSPAGMLLLSLLIVVIIYWPAGSLKKVFRKVSGYSEKQK